MKSGELRKIARSFAPLLPSPWRQIGNEFFRREGSWIQIIAFDPSRFADKYVPQCCFEFLEMPGEPIGAFLGQGLLHANNTQRWVELTERPSEVFEDMARQFRPLVLGPLLLEEIRQLLTDSLSYWPHAYALCVMCAKDGDGAGAQRYFEAFLSAIADKPYPWVESRRQELAECLKLMGAMSELKARLASVEVEKLRALKCDGKL